jgi:sugar lactone lactonase YvrE
LVLFFILTAEAQALDFTYTNTNGTISITGYTGPGGNVTIPSTIAGLAVTSIGANAFLNLTNLTNVAISDSVTYIGPDAFAGCSSLTNVTIGRSVTNMGASAFAYCPSLASVYFEGDAPTVVANVFVQSPATVYYPAGTTGFGPLFAGHPTALYALPYALGTSTVLVGPAAGSNSVALAVSPEAGVWTAATSVPWLHLAESFQGGIGSTNVVFSFDTNPGPTRSGTLTIAGITFTVIQAGATYVSANAVRLFSTNGWNMYGIAVNGAGNVYVTVTNLGDLVLWTAASNTATVLASGWRPPPMGVAAYWGTNFYISTPLPAIYDFFFLLPSGDDGVTLFVPVGPFALDAVGNLYIAHSGEIDEWTVSNLVVNPVNKWVNPGISNPGAIAVDNFGKNVYFTSGNSLQKWTAANNSVAEVASPGSFPGFDAATYNSGALAVDRGGNLYFSAYGSSLGPSVIMRWNAAGNNLSVLASSSSLPSGQFYSAQFSGVAVDKAGNVYFSDNYGGVLYEQPNAFVDVSPKSEGLVAGQDSLPPVLPSTANLRAPLFPVSDSSWLSIVGVTNGVVSYSFSENLRYPRTGHITVLGNFVEVTQNGPLFALGATNLCEGSAAGSDSVVLAVIPNVGIWTATNNAPWLHLSGAFQGGIGSTNVIFSFDANPGPTRSGTLTIANQTVTVTQAGKNYIKTGPVTTLLSSGLSGPSGVAVGGMGNVYIADTYGNSIKEWFASDNALTTLVSSGLNRPQGVAVDGMGNVYIADTENSAVKEWIAASNLVITLVASGLNRPQGVAVDSKGNVYIADTFDSTIKEWVAASNQMVTLVSSTLLFPAGVAVDGAGNVYIADSGNSAIKKWTVASESVSTLIAMGSGYISGVAVDGKGNVCVADTNNLVIEEWIAASNTLVSVVSSGLNGLSSVAVGGPGNVYYTDTENRLVGELPYAFVDPSPRLESLAAGNDSLPVVLPVTQNLQPPFAPTSDQAWLTITGISNGVVSFSFTSNTGPSRTAHIILLGQSIPITQGLIGTKPSLTKVQTLGNGVIQFSFTNNPSASFTVLSTTNLTLPLDNWAVVGLATNISSNLFQFTSQPTTNDQQRFYTVRSP